MRHEEGWRSEWVFLFVALGLGLAGLIYAYATTPTRLRVAVGPAGSSDELLMSAFAEQLSEQRVGLRLKLVPALGVRDAAALLDKGRADLAVVRPDVSLPANGLTLAILRDAAAIVVAPKEKGIDDLSDLGGRKLGILLNHEADPGLVALILEHFDLDPPAVTTVVLGHDQVGPALKSGEVDAVVIVASPNAPTASGLVRNLARAIEGGIAIVPIADADAMSQRSLVLSATTIPEGIWGGRPKQPADDVKTIGVSYRLMARSNLDRSTVAAVTEALFQMRSRLAAKTRAANLMRPPETDATTNASLPNHPGAVDYFQREQQSVMDRYGDWIYLAAFFGSGVVSVLAGLRQRFRRQRREQVDDALDRLLAIVAEARAAADPNELDALTAEIDHHLELAVGYARSRTTGSTVAKALGLALDGARAAVADRRRALAEDAASPARRDGSGPRALAGRFG